MGVKMVSHDDLLLPSHRVCSQIFRDTNQHQPARQKFSRSSVSSSLPLNSLRLASPAAVMHGPKPCPHTPDDSGPVRVWFQLAAAAMAVPNRAARLTWCRIGKGAMGACHVTGRVLGPAWNALDYTCETFGTATVAVLVAVKRTLEASFYAFRLEHVDEDSTSRSPDSGVDGFPLTFSMCCNVEAAWPRPRISF